MTSADQLPATVLKRKAAVEEARRHGFVHVEVIDDDLGRSASGTVVRPGFDRQRRDSSGAKEWAPARRRTLAR